MKEMVEFLAKHGYWLLFVSVLGRQACLPVPANLLLLAAGALAGLGRVSFAGVMILSVAAFVVADLAWFEGGRRWGFRTLHFLCGTSRNPGSCAEKIAKNFNRRGVKSLLFSKFVIGLDAVAVPMSGISGIDRRRFLLFEVTGATLWSFTYATLGYVFSDQLDRLATYSARMGTMAVLAAIVGLSVFIVLKLVRWYRFLCEFRLARITPDELEAELATPDQLLILDLQGHTKRAAGLEAIPGAVRIDPWELGRYIKQYRGADLETDRQVILYCDSPGEAMSARVALALRRMGFQRVRPLAGGFQAWRKCGFPVTADVQMLPLPEHQAYVLREVLQYSRTNAAKLLKTSTVNVDRLLDNAWKHIGSGGGAQVLLPAHCDPAGAIDSAPAKASRLSTPD